MVSDTTQNYFWHSICGFCAMVREAALRNVSSSRERGGFELLSRRSTKGDRVGLHQNWQGVTYCTFVRSAALLNVIGAISVFSRTLWTVHHPQRTVQATVQSLTLA